MNEFENYIKSQKDAIDTEDFSLEIWERIENELPKKRRIKVIPLWWTSAAAIILIAFLIGNFQNKTLSPNEYLFNNGINTLEIEAALDKKIDTLKEMKVPVNQKRDFEAVLNQLKILDQEYLEYLEYIEQNGYQESVGERIIEYYKTKIKILDKIQQQIKEINYYEKKYNKKSKKEALFI